MNSKEPAKSKGNKLRPLRIIIAEGSVAGCYDPKGNRRPYWPNRCDECPEHSDLVCPPKKRRKRSSTVQVYYKWLEREEREDVDIYGLKL